MQVLAPATVHLRRGLVRYLAGVPHIEATRALARLAIFAPESEIRRSAIVALKVRRDQDYADILLQGVRYPWPAIAQHATEAAVQLNRTDLVKSFVALLDEPDPRAPVLEEVDHKPVSVVRELVRINHHRNCMLCHAPGQGLQSNAVMFSSVVPAPSVAPPPPATLVPAVISQPAPIGPGSLIMQGTPLTAQVPIPDEPLPTPSQGYGSTIPDILVRIDVTYLRQDFSLLQPVSNAAPWPEMQRFDYLVRKRIISDLDACALTAELSNREADGQTPYRRAVHAALCKLTGRNAEPRAEAWRRLLN
jgi:hypothetical protein